MSNHHPRQDRALVLIAAFSNWEGLSRLPWLLHRAGAEVEVFSPARSFVSQSSWVSRHIQAPDTLPEFIEALKAHVTAREGAWRWTVVGDDPLIYELGRRRHQAWARQLLPCRADDASVDFMVSKIRFLQRCEEAGIPLPPSRVCRSPADLHDAVDELGLPMVLKAEEGFGGLSLRVIESHEQLTGIEWPGPCIAQAFVKGPVCSAAAFYDHGELAGFYAYRRTRTWGRYGASTAITFEEFPGLQRILQSLGQQCGFHGLSGIDLIRSDATGQLYVLEQNFRPTLTMLLGRRVGADLVPCVNRALQGEPVMQPLLLQDPQCRQMVPLFPSDLLRSIDGNDLLGVLRWLCLPGYWREMHWHDRQARRHAMREIGRVVLRKFARAWSRLERLEAAAPVPLTSRPGQRATPLPPHSSLPG